MPFTTSSPNSKWFWTHGYRATDGYVTRNEWGALLLQWPVPVRCRRMWPVPLLGRPGRRRAGGAAPGSAPDPREAGTSPDRTPPAPGERAEVRAGHQTIRGTPPAHREPDQTRPDYTARVADTSTDQEKHHQTGDSAPNKRKHHQAVSDTSPDRGTYCHQTRDKQPDHQSGHVTRPENTSTDPQGETKTIQDMSPDQSTTSSPVSRQFNHKWARHI